MISRLRNSIQKLKAALASPSGIAITLALILIVGSFICVFWSHQATWHYMGADEDVWVRNAIQHWHQREGSSISHTPLFHDMIVPFVCGFFFSEDVGYVVWRFVLYLFSYVVFFYSIRKLTNTWIALILTLHFMLTIDAPSGATYIYLAMTFYLVSLAVLLHNKKLIGVALGIMLLGSLVRFELLVSVIVAAVLLLIYCRSTVFTVGFLKQLSIPLAIFVGLLYWHGSSVTRFPRDFSSRGQLSVVWYMVDFLYQDGYFAKYTDLGRGSLPLELQDKVLRENFGGSTKELNELTLYELLKRNPKIVAARYADMFHRLPYLIHETLEIRFPWAPNATPTPYGLVVFCLAILPAAGLAFLRRLKKGRMSMLATSYHSAFGPFLTNGGFSRELLIFLVSGLGAFGPWFLTFPHAHYLVLIVPFHYVAFSIVAFFLLEKFDRALEARLNRTPSRLGNR